MKPKLSLPICTLLFVFLILPCTAQIPQGFNYQAIVRDGVTKQPITSQPVLIRMTIENGIGTDLYQETHSLSTDEFGIISIIAGQGTPWGTSDFDEIDWNDEPLSIKTEVQYPVGGSYTEMGTAPLMSVPYAMVADSLGGPLKNLKVKGSATTPDTEALFEVKNTTGQTVFAVYNEGVRIYVNDEDAKGAKGGFAIGGFGMGKTIPHQYMFISGDSVRFNIDNSDDDKGPKGGFAIGGFGTVKGLTQKYLMVSNDSVRVYVDNSDADKGPKGGFAIGGYGTAKGKPQDLLVVNNDSVRIYVDNNETDKGPKGGFAIGGYGTDKGKPQKLLTVSNDSIRMYINEGAKGPKGGFAIGGFDQAKGDGNNTNFFNVATSASDTIDPSEPRILWYPLKNAFLTGQVLIELIDSVGTNSTATGFESKAVGDQSQAMGYQAIARGDYSTSIGYQSLARKNNSFAFGQWAQALNQESYALGRGAISEGFRSFAFGSAGVDSAGVMTGVAYSKGDYSFAIGQGSQSYGIGSVTLGVGNTANGDYSLAIGYSSIANEYGSLSFGVHNEATRFATAIGFYAKALFPMSIALGAHNTAEGGYANAIGLGSYAYGNGSTAIGYAATATGGGFASGYMTNASSGVALGFSTTASNYGTATGVSTIASGQYSFAAGGETTASNSYAAAFGYSSKASGPHSFAAGYRTEAKGDLSSVAVGYNVLASGNISTATGNNTHAKGSGSFTMGTWSIAAGSNSLATGYLTKTRGSYTSTFGYYTYAKPYGSVALGRFNDTTCSVSGMTSWIDTDPVFIIGNGTADNARKNALTVLKNGMVGIGTGTVMPTHLLDVRGQMRITESIDYDVWIQGGSVTGSGYTDNRNLALLGFDEDFGDKLFVNFLAEYAGGTEIGGPVFMPAVYSTAVTPTYALYIQSDGKIGHSTSSLKYKENIINLDSYDWLFDLRPVVYNYKNTDPLNIQYGLIAEEVNKINSNLVIYDADNNPDGLMYEKLTVPMLKAIQDQKKEIESLKETISRLEALVEKLMEEN